MENVRSVNDRREKRKERKKKETKMEDRNIYRDGRQRQRDEREKESEQESEAQDNGCEKEGTAGRKERLSGASHCHVLRRPPTSSSRMTRARPKSPITAVPSSVSCAAVRTTQKRVYERERERDIDRER